MQFHPMFCAVSMQETTFQNPKAFESAVESLLVEVLQFQKLPQLFWLTLFGDHDSIRFALIATDPNFP